jgi:hypothetical protein
MSFSEHFSQLVSLQWFDPEAFKEDSEVSRDVCGFVLSLSLIYNDIKNTALLNRVLNESRPPEPITESKDWGEFSALENFIDRMTIGILHELFNLIKHTNKTLDDKYFKSVIKSIPKDFREYWQAIVETSFEGYSNNKLTKDLMVIRNKIGFHYDLKVILNGYKYFFENNKSKDKAYISRGRNMPESRFYFADAAAQGCVQSISKDVSLFNSSIEETLKRINLALWHIINNFITKRGYAFREVRN